jgi:hypothetical protein
MEFLIVEFAILDVPRKGDRSEIANCNLIWGCVLDDLAAEVGALDRPEVLVV